MRFRYATVALLIAVFATAPGAQTETVYKPGDGVTLPVLIKRVTAKYTSEAMQQRIEGTVRLDTVVNSDGHVGEVTVVKSLDSVYGLDNEAVKAVKQFEFKAGTKDGKPVAVRVTIEVTFTLK